MRHLRHSPIRSVLPGGTASVATAFLAAATLGFATAGPVGANGIGDLYAASSAGVLELHVESARIVNTVPIAPAPTELAFSPDGRTLYAGAGGRHLVTVDIESISASGTIDLPDAAVALAYPKGEELVLAFPASKTLGVLDTATQNVIQSSVLPGAVDLLAADRRDDRVIAAQSNGSWVAVFDPGSGSVRTATIPGHVQAIGFDRADMLALVATQAPNRIVAISLATAKTSWSATLPGAPTAVTALGVQPLVAVGSAVWAVTRTSAAKWADAAGSVEALAPSDEGTVIYAQEEGQVEAFASTGKAVRTIKLSGTRAPAAIAPVPHASSIADGAGGSDGTGTGTGSGTGSATSGSTPASGGGKQKPPSTDTVVDDAMRWVGTRQVLPGAIAVGVAILVLGQLAILWYERRRPAGS